MFVIYIVESWTKHWLSDGRTTSEATNQAGGQNLADDTLLAQVGV